MSALRGIQIRNFETSFDHFPGHGGTSHHPNNLVNLVRIECEDTSKSELPPPPILVFLEAAHERPLFRGLSE